MSTIWQQLGAFVATGSDLSDSQLEEFSKIGGKWFCPVIYGDNKSGPWNLENIESLKQRGAKYGMQVGGWFNCWGDEPSADATLIASCVNAHGLPLAILDLEASYQFPDGDPSLMPELVRALRRLLPDTNIAVSTNNMNNSMIWNGRTLHPPLSFYDLGIRVMPQWYSWMYEHNHAYRPDINMRWLRENGSSDFNFADLNAAKVKQRGVPLSYVHGTLEVTGLENSDLADELSWLLISCQHGYSAGLSIYLLENMPPADFVTLEKYRGLLYFD